MTVYASVSSASISQTQFPEFLMTYSGKEMRTPLSSEQEPVDQLQTEQGTTTSQRSRSKPISSTKPKSGDQMTSNSLRRLPPPTFERVPLTLEKISLAREPSEVGPSTITLSINPLDSHSWESGHINEVEDELSRAVWYALWDVFGSSSESEFDLQFGHGFSSGQQRQLRDRLQITSDRSRLKIDRSWWYQNFPIYSDSTSTSSFIKNASQPDRVGKTVTTLSAPPKVDQSLLPQPPKTFYERYIPGLQTYFCLSVYGDSEEDIDILHQWLNEPRVEEFWKDGGDREFHVEWLKKRYENEYVLPVLGSYRTVDELGRKVIEPFAYYEIYWASKEKISKFYKGSLFDRGIHMLVGSNEHRGPHRVQSWLPSLLHYIFTDDRRVPRIVSEPDIRNKKMIGYLEKYGFKNLYKEGANLGHKYAAIMILEREAFWKSCPL